MHYDAPPICIMNHLQFALRAPEAVLAGDVPRLLDEWQHAPTLWNRVRRECDDRAKPGQFTALGP